MKLATYRAGGSAGVGVVLADGRVFDPRAAAERAGRDRRPFASMLDLIDGGAPALDRLRALVDRHGDDAAFSRPLREVELLAPLPEPRQMRDAMTFPVHILQGGAGMRRLAARLKGDEEGARGIAPLTELPPVYRDRPIFYLTNRFSVVGPGATVNWPRYSTVMDFELELAVVTGRTCANVSAADAGGCIFGYTIYNDFSARDAQMLEMPGMLGPAKGKSFDTGNALGPWIATPDEVGDARALDMRVRVNGVEWSRGNSRDMMYSFEELLAYISRDETIRGGEVIGSGTMGNGCGLELDRYLSHGDVVELEVERIGVLSNTVARQNP